MVDDAGSENNPSKKEGTPFVRNPANCTAPYTEEKLLSPFMGSMGATEGLSVIRIKRPSPTSSSRSPWKIRMLSRRHECTFSYFFQIYLVEEAKIVSLFNSSLIVGANIMGGEMGDYKRNLAQEYCQTDLAYIISQRYGEGTLGPRPLEAPKAMKVAEGILEALDFLHNEAYLMHGDLKSFNVLVQGDFESVKLCGLSKMSRRIDSFGMADDDGKPPGDEYGNAVALGLWSAPELFEGKPVSTKADIWSFGLVVFEMLTGYPPHTFPGVMDNALAEPDEVLGMRKPPARNDSDVVVMDEDDTDCVMLEEDDMSKKQKNLKAGGPMLFARKRKPLDLARHDGAEGVEEGEDGEERGWIKKAKAADGNSTAAAVTGRQVTIDLLNDEDDTPTYGSVKPKEPEKNGLLINASDEATPSSTAPVISKTDAGVAAVVPAVAGEVSSSEGKEPPGNNPAIAAEEGSNADCKAEVGVAASTEGTVPKVTNYDDVSDQGKYLPGEATAAKGEATSHEPKKRANEPAEVVMVLDSSEEEDDTGMYSVPSRFGGLRRPRSSSDESENDDSFEQDEFYDEEDEEAVSEIDSELEDDNFINYASLGTRPPIPSEITLGPEYRMLLELFAICTREQPADRPYARQLLTAIKECANASKPQSIAPDQPNNN